MDSTNKTTEEKDISSKINLDVTEMIDFINKTNDSEESVDLNKENDLNVGNVNVNKVEEYENDVINVRKKQKRLTIVDSESDDEIHNESVKNGSDSEDIVNKNDEKPSNNNDKKKKKRIILPESDEDSNLAEETNKNDYDSKNSEKINKISLIYDSEDSNPTEERKEDDFTYKNHSNDIKNTKKHYNSDVDSNLIENDSLFHTKDAQKPKQMNLYDTESDSDEISNDNRLKRSGNDENSHNSAKKSRLTALCDSESSENEENDDDFARVRRFDFNDEQPESKQKKSKPRKPQKPKKMTGKEAMEQRREIQSESQRMMREQPVSLPYHKPKTHTLQDFLQKRKNISDIMKIDRPSNLNMKLTRKQLEDAHKKLEERQKEFKEFCKNEESEGEAEDNIVEKPQEIDDMDVITTLNEKQTITPSENIHEMEVDEITTIKDNENKNTTDLGNVSNEECTENEILDMLDKFDDSDQENKETENDNSENNSEINIKSIDIHENTVNKSSKILDMSDTLPKSSKMIENHENIQIEPPKSSKTLDFHENTESTDPESSTIIDISENTLPKSSKMIVIHENIQIIPPESSKIVDIHENSVSKSSKMLEIHENTESTDSESSKILDIHENIQINPAKSSKTLDIPENTTNTVPKSSKLLEKLKKLNPLLLLKTDFKPTFSSSKDVIVLDEDVEKSRAISELKKRFLAHNSIKPVHMKDEIKIVDSNVLKHEAAKVLIDHDVNEKRTVELKPGEKLKKLRQELEVQMAKKRWEQYEKLQKEIEEKEIEEKGECGGFDDNDDEEEEDMTESSSSSSEDDEDEQMEIVDKPRMKSAFVDDEAEVSEDEEDDSESENEEDDHNNETESSKKELKRIITLDDSEDENETRNQSLNTTQSIDDNQSLDIDSDDDQITVYQKENLNETPKRLSDTKSEIILTPTECLSGLKDFSAKKRQMLASPAALSLLSQPEPSPLRSHSGVKMKLFESNDVESMSQAYDELLGLCSGKFSSGFSKSCLNSQNQELLDLCSGKFDCTIPESTQSNSNKFDVNIPGYTEDMLEKNVNMDDELREMSKNIQKELENEGNSNENNDINDDSQDMKLTFEEEDEINVEKKTEDDVKKVEKFPVRKLVILSSDEEEEQPKEDISVRKKKKRKRKAVEFSDDEESDLDSESLEEDVVDMNPTERDYDSEENEVVYDENEDIVTEKTAKNFFEAEAELTESEWGSEDEDERGLDLLEREEGDSEQFNEDKLQKELGKIHMRQVLDQDNREVRLLQELLLEDGELHGAGRERKFKWKNADSMTWGDDKQNDDEDEDVEEIESELEWRKTRHEREVFLEEQRKKTTQNTDEIEILTNDSQVMKLGHEILKKSQEINNEAPVVVPPRIETFGVLNKRSFRGSFLARSETTLVRLAEMTKSTDKDFTGSSGPKNSRNFVFKTVNKSNELEEDDEEENDKKRKAGTPNTPAVLKKMRLSEDSPSAGRSSKKSKKSLFSQL